VALFATILSFADPITDILTLVEFYREDHKTWFSLAITFLFLPSLVLSTWPCFEKGVSRTWKLARFFLWGFNPFSVALKRLRVLIFFLKNFKKLWQDEKIEFKEDTVHPFTTELLLTQSELFGFYEAVFESTPQFIIQLYIVSVQQEPVHIIQIISLPVSFLSLVWASTVADEVIQSKRYYEHTETAIDVPLKVKDKTLLVVTQLFLLSSRLFAIAFFTVSYKWWIISVLMIHSMAIVLVDTIWLYRSHICNAENLVRSALYFCFHWLRDDWSMRTQELGLSLEIVKKQLKSMQLFSNGLFVAENIAMILVFYFSPFSNTWYSLPITICVCSFSVLGATMRVTHFHFLIGKTSYESVSPPSEQSTTIVPSVVIMADIISPPDQPHVNKADQQETGILDYTDISYVTH